MSGRTWRTWSETVGCTPSRWVTPRSEEEIVAAVRSAAERGTPLRAAGTGHSFNALAATDGVLLDLRRYEGVVGISAARDAITVRAGTSIRTVNTALARAGLALENIGTLAEQTVAGALSTGNHGSGLAHGPLSELVTGLRLVTATGDVLDCGPDRDPGLFRCARTSLGALGVITEVTLACVPSFNLHVRSSSLPFDELLGGFGEWAGSAEHVAANWLPWRESVSARALSVTERPVTPQAGTRPYWASFEEVRCGLIGLASRAGAGWVPPLTDASGRLGIGGDYVGESHRVFCFPQPVKFLALEHALPLGSVPDALRELRGALRRFGFWSPYSVLLRVGAAADAPLSPAYGRATGYVNLTVPRSVRYLELLRLIEHVLREHAGRPHWGKAHTATTEVLAPRYPEWREFQRVRARLDPGGVFRSDYLHRVLGPVQAAEKVPAGLAAG